MAGLEWVLPGSSEEWLARDLLRLIGEEVYRASFAFPGYVEGGLTGGKTVCWREPGRG